MEVSSQLVMACIAAMKEGGGTAGLPHRYQYCIFTTQHIYYYKGWWEHCRLTTQTSILHIYHRNYTNISTPAECSAESLRLSAARALTIAVSLELSYFAGTI